MYEIERVIIGTRPKMALSNNGNVAMCKLFYPACVEAEGSVCTIKAWASHFDDKISKAEDLNCGD